MLQDLLDTLIVNLKWITTPDFPAKMKLTNISAEHLFSLLKEDPGWKIIHRSKRHTILVKEPREYGCI